MYHDQRHLNLDYLIEQPLGGQPLPRQRNVRCNIQELKRVKGSEYDYSSNPFGYKLARRLEGREGVDDWEGIWPINFFRCDRRFGHPPLRAFNRDMDLPPEGDAIYDIARAGRGLCYWRTASVDEVQRLAELGRGVRFGCLITSDWYDPPRGVLSFPVGPYQFAGSHSVEIVDTVNIEGQQYFVFNNWWGGAWGNAAQGAISFTDFERFRFEAWTNAGIGLAIPYSAKAGFQCLKWKYSITDAIGIHGREIIDAATDERIAWAFCIRRDGYLDIEEFYVWPTARRQGYGRVLAEMVRELAVEMGLPLRLLVSFADTEHNNREILDIAARLLGVELEETNENWVHLVGTAASTRTEISRWRPPRPANMVERLRPRDEAPINTPTEYDVYFGTNRRPTEDGAFPYFTEARDAQLHVGKSRITIPVCHKFGSQGRMWHRVWGFILGRRPGPLPRIVLLNAAELTRELHQMQDAFANTDDGCQNLLYVHGFNVSFEDALNQAAQLGVDLKVPGGTFCFSWPSAGRLRDYMVDEATIEASIPYLESFVDLILGATGDTPLNILVHSMGNRAVLRILERLAARMEPAHAGRIRSIMLAAPDVDAEVFGQQVARFVPITERTTLYANRADGALLPAGWLHGYPRAGLAPPVTTVDGMDTVLVEGFGLLDLAHGYVATASPLLHDLFMLVRYCNEPAMRPALTRRETLDGREFWKLELA